MLSVCCDIYVARKELFFFTFYIDACVVSTIMIKVVINKFSLKSCKLGIQMQLCTQTAADLLYCTSTQGFTNFTVFLFALFSVFLLAFSEEGNCPFSHLEHVRYRAWCSKVLIFVINVASYTLSIKWRDLFMLFHVVSFICIFVDFSLYYFSHW